MFRKIMPIFKNQQDTPTIDEAHDDSGTNSKNEYQISRSMIIPHDFQFQSALVIAEDDVNTKIPVKNISNSPSVKSSTKTHKFDIKRSRNSQSSFVRKRNMKIKSIK